VKEHLEVWDEICFSPSGLSFLLPKILAITNLEKLLSIDLRFLD
jgi:hypothetical protein